MKKRKAAVLAAAAFAMTAAFFLNGIRRAEAADNVVVMLDPGHDSTHTGAAAYGLKEQQLNLKIGLACRTELDRKSTRLNSSHSAKSRMPSSA